MDQLAFKYMDMCKVESSTDTDSEISPRLSDTSNMGCVSSAPECGTSGWILRPLKPAARHGCSSLFLDPYDGSSEDSDESDLVVGVTRRTRQQGQGGSGGRRFLGRSRRFILHHPAAVALRDSMKHGMKDPVTEQQHPLDVQMKCGSDPELWVCELDTVPSHSNKDSCGDLTAEMTNDLKQPAQTMDIEVQLDDSGLYTTRSSTPLTPGPLTPVVGSSSWLLGSSSERSLSPCNLRSLYKRKLGLPGAEVGQSKRQCVVNMEDEEAGDSASEPC
ncbi:uncharacterized protein LOC118285653 isoform X2 [Scophthalmus maximus]|uniref:uncharacterized protein LOC118285653 isoform X2 n=1 Tax=Scophthalmus maximus TaxID=52904 RepID=UPI0015E0B2E4|nr:uncharacterized protein LOC118285653 isoform X2 [Scophthalmus maximus]XP_035465291.1 uncharacterized protein LOC118285653 isoform X2 [Scophthalmus maximus]